MSARGYAYMDQKGDLVVRTVSDTASAAMVNAIYLATYGNVMPPPNASEAVLADMLAQVTGGAGHIVEVEICRWFGA